MEWVKVNKDIINKAPEIVHLKKGELQIKYAEVLVKLEKARKLLKERVKVIPFDENGEGGSLEISDYDLGLLIEILGEDKDV